MKESIRKIPSFLRHGKHVHMIGIGGIGMSGIAELLLNKGLYVSGSDIDRNTNVKHLQGLGIEINIGHHPTFVQKADIVVYSSAISVNSNVELKAAISKNIPTIKRAEMLLELMRMKYSIAIAGSHGKTTTTSMIGQILQKGNFSPTVVVGGHVHSFHKSNVVIGKGDVMIVEADEYDHSFLKLFPSLAVITNIDNDHMDIYINMDNLKKAFIEFVMHIPFYGILIACLDDAHIRTILPKIQREKLTYGFCSDALLRGFDLQTDGWGTCFKVNYKGEILNDFSISLFGKYNVQNALAAIACGLKLGMPVEEIKQGLKAFKGVIPAMSIS